MSSHKRYNRGIDTVGTEVSDFSLTGTESANGMNPYDTLFKFMGNVSQSGGNPQPNTGNSQNNNKELDFVADENTTDSVDFTISDTEDVDQSNGNAAQNQSGGFFGSWFGRKDKASSKAYTNVTALLSAACDQGNIVALDFILQRPFVPDFTFKNVRGDNIYHILSRCATKSFSARNAIAFMLDKHMGSESLNEENEDGDTPLHFAVKYGLNDIACMMEDNGAVRKANNQMMIIETVRDSSDDESSTTEDVDAGNDMGGIADSASVVIIRTRDDDPNAPIAPNQENPVANELERMLNMFKGKITGESTVLPDTDKDSVRPRDNTENDVYDTVRSAFKKAASNASKTPSKVSKIFSSAVESSRPIRKSVSRKPNQNVQSSPSDIADIVAAFKTGTVTDTVLPDTEDLDNASVVITQGQNQSGGSWVNNRLGMIGGTRKMGTYSDTSVTNSEAEEERENILSQLARTASSEKDKLHAAALEKIKEHIKKLHKVSGELSADDVYLAKAVKAILYRKVKEGKPELSGLDRIQEIVDSITQASVKKAMEEKETIKSIITHMKAKDTERAKRLSEGISDKPPAQSEATSIVFEDSALSEYTGSEGSEGSEDYDSEYDSDVVTSEMESSYGGNDSEGTQNSDDMSTMTETETETESSEADSDSAMDSE